MFVTYFNTAGMNSNKYKGLFLLAIVILMGACNDNAWDDVAGPMQEFITKYFPFGEVKSCVESPDGNQTVNINNGATIVFDSDYVWVSVNGNGVVLPEMFIYDQFPSTLYNYLKENDWLGSVYSVTRTTSKYVVYLLNTTIEYDVVTGEITFPSAS